VSSLPTPNPEAKNIARENSLIQGAIPKFVSKGAVHSGEGGEESTDVQVKTDKEEQEEEKGDDASTMIGSIVANRHHDGIKKSGKGPDRGEEEGEEVGGKREGHVCTATYTHLNPDLQFVWLITPLWYVTLII